MKITATIANDRDPQGWVETYTAFRHDATAEIAEEQVQALLKSYNSTLVGNDLPRRLLSLELSEYFETEAWDMGKDANQNTIFDDAADNYWPKDHPLAEHWLAGWMSAEDDEE